MLGVLPAPLAHRQPPASIEAEQALVGAIIVNPRVLDRVAEFLIPEHFAEPLHGRLYNACRTMANHAQAINPAALRLAFVGDMDLAKFGGDAYLDSLIDAGSTVVSAADYGRLIVETHQRRELIALGEDVVNEAFNPDIESPVAAMIEKIETRLMAMTQGEQRGDLQDFSAGLGTAIDQMQRARDRGGALPGIPTGFTDLDWRLNGLQGPDLIILAGRPSMGKTALASNIAFHAAHHLRETEAKPRAVAFFSLEMSVEQMASRELSARSGYPIQKMRRGDLSPMEMAGVVSAHEELLALTGGILYIDETPAITLAAIRQRCRRLARRRGLAAVFIDYLQLIGSPAGRRYSNRVEELSDITRTLKALAKELGVPIVCLSQLSRAPELRDDHRPQLSDLRESGSIEQDADIVLMLFREEYYLERNPPTQKQGEAEGKFMDRQNHWYERRNAAASRADIIIPKNRQGPSGSVSLHWDGTRFRFSNLAHEDA